MLDQFLHDILELRFTFLCLNIKITARFRSLGKTKSNKQLVWVETKDPAVQYNPNLNVHRQIRSYVVDAT